MTCIVGYIHKNDFGQKSVWLGGDSSGLSGWDLHQRKDPKVFKVGKFVIGFTTSFRMGQILQHSFNPPPQQPDEDLYKYMCTSFIDEVRRTLHAKGFAERKNDREGGGQFLVGVDGRLFNIESDYQVGENIHGFDAVGCGCGPAIGALAILKEQKANDPREIVTAALKISETFNGGVRGPFNVVVAYDETPVSIDISLYDEKE